MMMIKYDKNNNPVRIISSPVDHNREWRAKAHLESFKERGNGWWIFNGVLIKKYKTWIEQFRKVK